MSSDQCVQNPYTNICTSTLLSSISGLQTLKLPVYQQFVSETLHSETLQHLYTIFPLVSGNSTYLIVQSGTDGSISFQNININTSGVLVSCYRTINVIPCIVVNYRGAIYLKYKNMSYRFLFKVPSIDLLVPIKKHIENLFQEDIQTFILFDKIVLIFARTGENPDDRVSSCYRLIYAGTLRDKKVQNGSSRKVVKNTTVFDYCNGTLVMLFDKKPYAFYNNNGLFCCNLFPTANFQFRYGSLAQNYIIQGGLNNYFIEPLTETQTLWKICYASELQYQADEFQADGSWGFTPVRSVIPIPNTCQTLEYPNSGPVFIMGFNSPLDPTKVLLGVCQFTNTENTIITFTFQIVFTNNPTAENWFKYPTNAPSPPTPNTPYLYYTIDQSQMIIYQPSFQSFLDKYKGGTTITDLNYSDMINKTFITQWTIPFNSTENEKYSNPLLSASHTGYDYFFWNDKYSDEHPPIMPSVGPTA